MPFVLLSLSLKITEPDTVVSEKTNQLLGVRGLPSVHLQLCLPPSKSKGSNPIPAAACGRNVKGDQVASSPALPSLPPSLTTFFSNERQELWTVLSARHFLQLLATCAASHAVCLVHFVKTCKDVNRVFEVLNEVYLQNFLHRWVVNREMNLMMLINPCLINN